MTAPASPPDLDALEARLLDAERNDLLVEHGVRFTDIKWLIAAARERDEWRKHHCEQRITTPCPSCGHQSLFIAVGGHLTCSWLKCREPSPEAAFKAERQRAEQAEEALADKREALARAVLAQETRPTWQPIETAPKDGTWMLLVGARWVVDGPVVGAWSSDHGGYWHDCERGITGVTHWMPLPAAPEAALAPEQEAG